MTFEEAWKTEGHKLDCENDTQNPDALSPEFFHQLAGWNARQSEIDAIKDKTIELQNYAKALEQTYKEAIDAVISDLGALATEIEKEPCTHAAYCRDETTWRKEIDAAKADAAQEVERLRAVIADIELALPHLPKCDYDAEVGFTCAQCYIAMAIWKLHHGPAQPGEQS